MTNALEEILSSLLTGNEAENKDNIRNLMPQTGNASEKGLKIQRKIDILKSFEPIVSEKNKEFINLFIKALSIAKLIVDMDIKN
jgi:hypothetical protein